MRKARKASDLITRLSLRVGPESYIVTEWNFPHSHVLLITALRWRGVAWCMCMVWYCKCSSYYVPYCRTRAPITKLERRHRRRCGHPTFRLNRSPPNASSRVRKVSNQPQLAREFIHHRHSNCHRHRHVVKKTIFRLSPYGGRCQPNVTSQGPKGKGPYYPISRTPDAATQKEKKVSV